MYLKITTYYYYINNKLNKLTNLDNYTILYIHI